MGESRTQGCSWSRFTFAASRGPPDLQGKSRAGLDKKVICGVPVRFAAGPTPNLIHRLRRQLPAGTDAAVQCCDCPEKSLPGCVRLPGAAPRLLRTSLRYPATPTNRRTEALDRLPATCHSHGSKQKRSDALPDLAVLQPVIHGPAASCAAHPSPPHQTFSSPSTLTTATHLACLHSDTRQRTGSDPRLLPAPASLLWNRNRNYLGACSLTEKGKPRSQFPPCFLVLPTIITTSISLLPSSPQQHQTPLESNSFSRFFGQADRSISFEAPSCSIACSILLTLASSQVSWYRKTFASAYNELVCAITPASRSTGQR